METIDTFCHSHVIDSIDLLKVDVEGAELSVFGGATEMLRRDGIRLAFVEIGLNSADTGHCFAADVISPFDQGGLHLYAIYDQCRLIPPVYVQAGRLPVIANALFVGK